MLIPCQVRTWRKNRLLYIFILPRTRQLKTTNNEKKVVWRHNEKAATLCTDGVWMAGRLNEHAKLKNSMGPQTSLDIQPSVAASNG